MSFARGIELLAEHEGVGDMASKGDRIVYNVRIFLHRGDEVPINETQAAHGLPAEILRHVDGRVFIDHRIVLGKRHAIAGVERTLLGMRAGGYRKVRVSPHLAYRDKGVPGLIPPDAVLVIEVWLREVAGPAR